MTFGETNLKAVTGRQAPVALPGKRCRQFAGLPLVASGISEDTHVATSCCRDNDDKDGFVI
jgi:hypothetical protein